MRRNRDMLSVKLTLVCCIGVLLGCQPHAMGSASQPAISQATVALAPPENASSTALDTLGQHALDYAAIQLRRSATTLDPSNGYPRSTRPDGSWDQRRASVWTSGFFPGLLWYMYQWTHEAGWRDQAERWTAGLEDAKNLTTTHDLGFVLFNSFGHGYQLTGNEHYREVVIQGSRTLARRYNPAVGAIKSWDTNNLHDRRRDWEFPVIIDNMMNLKMLFWAGAHGGDPAWRTLAERHAATSLHAHVRADGSTAHVALFDPRTGAFVRQTTWQGYADSSAWARGQAWAIYGFTTAFAETGRVEFRDGAERAADYFIAHIPADGVPYWDFRDPAIPNAPRDASAAAIAASALLNLSEHTSGPVAARYRAAAVHILTSLCRNYLTTGTSSAAILQHSVGGKPQNDEVDVGIVYADYYFVEALLHYQDLRRAGLRRQSLH